MQLAGIELSEDNFPDHLGVIMDGNGRWAEVRGKSRNRGHRAGMQTLKKMLETIELTPIKTVSLYVFSRENWKRSEEELNGLFNLLRQFYKSEYPKLKKRGVKIIHSGDSGGLEADVVRIMRTMVEETVDNTGKVLNLCLNYSGRDELTRAVRKIVAEGIPEEEITESVLYDHLDNPDAGCIDLLIRTSGELRISNFSLWQCAYSEFYFTDVYWPDFTDEHLAKAILSYQSRERRFGGRINEGKEVNLA